MIAILGAGGAIATELSQQLAASGASFRLVSRRVDRRGGRVEAIPADLTDLEQTVGAVRGAAVAVLTAGLAYNRRVWEEDWPRIMANAIEACQRADARLVFFDNVYMYGRIYGAMTEATPFRPVSRKGEIRARIAAMLEDEWKAARLTGMIARSADFYGPGASTGVANRLVFDRLRQGRAAICLARDDEPHAYTYVPDAVRALLQLIATPSAWNQTWHLPTAPAPPTGKAFIRAAGEALRVEAKYRVMDAWVVRLGGWFDPAVREIHEMLYQYDAPYLFDSQKYCQAFGAKATPYEEGIRATAAYYLS
jgi:nucleoside-diphosphate-sugar epimerase